MLRTIGVDEAGRGCWAGPLVAAAVLLHQPIDGLDDSKKLSKNRRTLLAEEIRQKSDYGLGWVSAKEIDAIGLTAATQQAMARAVDSITSDYDEIVIDGNLDYLPGHTGVRVLPKADSLIASVSAASILAKVARDEYMTNIADEYPQYEFARHVGYGTALHHELIRKYGPCELHRISYKPLQAIIRIQDV